MENHEAKVAEQTQGPRTASEAQCDCCARMVPRDEISRCWTSCGIETFACDDCRGWNK
jgi:hypothetical protein